MRLLINSGDEKWLITGNKPFRLIEMFPVPKYKEHFQLVSSRVIILHLFCEWDFKMVLGVLKKKFSGVIEETTTREKIPQDLLITGEDIDLTSKYIMIRLWKDQEMAWLEKYVKTTLREQGFKMKYEVTPECFVVE